MGRYMFFLLLSFMSSQAFADTATINFQVGNLWILIATALVFVMHLGFATLEAGLTQRKNTVNILFKNVTILAVGLLTYSLVGFNLMYPGEDFAGGLIGFSGLGIGTDAAGLTPEYNANYTYWTDFIFQAMFAATAATIVSGAVAERVKISTIFIFSVLLLSICYPIVGMWKWGGGFLDTLQVPFYDFAGSTLVHSVGGWAALAGAMLLGPRLGKYCDTELEHPLGPHSMPLATIGAFLLWFGWFGFNGGSVLSSDPGAIGLVFVTTCLAGAGGIFGSIIMTQLTIRKMDLSMVLNGALAGLVGITAGADQMLPAEAIMIGFIAGCLVVLSVLFFDRIRIDDPVGAISVHLICGIWGTLAVGLFGSLASWQQFISQLTGVAATGAFTFAFSFGILRVLKAAYGIRVSKEVELSGLDMHEHGLSAYRGYYWLVKEEQQEYISDKKPQDHKSSTSQKLDLADHPA